MDGRFYASIESQLAIPDQRNISEKSLQALHALLLSPLISVLFIQKISESGHKFEFNFSSFKKPALLFLWTVLNSKLWELSQRDKSGSKVSVFKLEQESLFQDLLLIMLKRETSLGPFAWHKCSHWLLDLHGKSSCFPRCYLEKGQDLDPAGVKMQNTITSANAVFSRAWLWKTSVLTATKLSLHSSHSIHSAGCTFVAHWIYNLQQWLWIQQADQALRCHKGDIHSTRTLIHCYSFCPSMDLLWTAFFLKRSSTWNFQNTPSLTKWLLKTFSDTQVCTCLCVPIWQAASGASQWSKKHWLYAVLLEREHFRLEWNF